MSKTNCSSKPKRAPRIGYVLHESDTVVVIATLKSKNRKTGPMVQVWILHRNVSPIDAVKLGLDSVVCFDCGHRAKGGVGFEERTCYVNLRSPQAIWKAYRRGRYPQLAFEGYSAVFGERKVRFGAYGEPVLIPVGMLWEIISHSRGWTGYTHQWRRPEFAQYRAYLMASCDSAEDYKLAHEMGWRTFRVRSKDEPLLEGEISCPASDEMNHKTTCIRCGLCNGARIEETRKSVGIIVHGSGAKNFVSVDSIIQIGKVA